MRKHKQVTFSLSLFPDDVRTEQQYDRVVCHSINKSIYFILFDFISSFFFLATFAVEDDVFLGEMTHCRFESQCIQLICLIRGIVRVRFISGTDERDCDCDCDGRALFELRERALANDLRFQCLRFIYLFRIVILYIFFPLIYWI